MGLRSLRYFFLFLLLGAAILCSCEKEEPYTLPDYSGYPSGTAGTDAMSSVYKYGLRELAQACGLKLFGHSTAAKRHTTNSTPTFWSAPALTINNN